jgi:hypothetical protein
MPLTFSPACSSPLVGKWRDKALKISSAGFYAPSQTSGRSKVDEQERQNVGFCPERNLGFDLTEIRVNETQNPK